MFQIKRVGIGASLAVLLSSCGGSGGGAAVNMTPAPPPVSASFASFSTVQASTPTTIIGSTREGSLTVDSAGRIPPTSVSTPIENTGSVTFTINNAKQLIGLSLTGAQSSVSFDQNNSTASTLVSNGQPVGVALSNASGSSQAIYADPYAIGFNYQSFGVWGSGIVPGASGRYGAISVGAKTSATVIPASGTATFRGVAGGIYLDNSGTGYRYGAVASFAVDFGTRTVGMVTSNDGITNISTNVTTSVATPITASMSYGAGSTNFSGTFRAGGFMSGTGAGTFYGPNANELGGTFFISGSSGALVGGFGATR